jgi:hypothetical protein
VRTLIRVARALPLLIAFGITACSGGGSAPIQCPYLGGSAVYVGGYAAALFSPVDGTRDVPTTIGTIQVQTQVPVFFFNPVAITVRLSPVPTNGQQPLEQAESVYYQGSPAALTLGIPTLASHTTYQVTIKDDPGCEHIPQLKGPVTGTFTTK